MYLLKYKPCLARKSASVMGQPCSNSPTGALILTGNLLLCVLKALTTIRSKFVVIIPLKTKFSSTMQLNNLFVTKDSNNHKRTTYMTCYCTMKSIEKDGMLLLDLIKKVLTQLIFTQYTKISFIIKPSLRITGLTLSLAKCVLFVRNAMTKWLVY